MKKMLKNALVMLMAALMLIGCLPSCEYPKADLPFASVAEAAVAVVNGNKVGVIDNYTTKVTYDPDTDTYGNEVTDIVFNSVKYPVSEGFDMTVAEVEAFVGETVVVHIYNSAVAVIESLESHNTALSVEFLPVTFSYAFDNSWWHKKKLDITGTVKNKKEAASWSEADKSELEAFLKLSGLSSFENVTLELRSADASKVFFDGVSKAAATVIEIADIINAGDKLDFSKGIYINTDYSPENGVDAVDVMYSLSAGDEIKATGKFTVNIENTDYDPMAEFEEISLEELLIMLRDKLKDYHPDNLQSKQPLEALFYAAIEGKKITELKGIYESFENLKVAIDANNMVTKADIGGLIYTASDAYLKKLFESIEEEAKTMSGYVDSAVDKLLSSDDFKDYLLWYETNYGYINGYYQKTNVNCPTNVRVTDEDGNIALTIIDNVITAYDELIYAYVNNGEKLFYLPTNIDYFVEITATDNGTMDYIVSSVTPGGAERVITYNDVPLTNGEGYKGLIPCESLQPTDTYNLVSEKGEIIESDSDTLPPVVNDITDVVVAEELFDDFSKELIDLVAGAMFDMKPSVSLTAYDISPEDTVALFSAISKYYPVEYSLLVNGEFTYRILYDVNLNKIIEIKFEYGNSVSLDEYRENVAAVRNEIALIVEKIEDMSDFEKALYVHDYIVLNCEYDTELLEILETQGTLTGEIRAERYTEYSVLINGTGICGSYALAYRAILNAAGMECLYLSSEAMNHAWNLVKLDGEWYHVDCCWDDPVPDSRGIARRTYFLRTDNEIMKLNHFSWTPGQYKATSEKYSSMPRYNDSRQKFDYTADSWYYLVSGALYKADKFGFDADLQVNDVSAAAIASDNGNIYCASDRYVYEYDYNSAEWAPVYFLSDSDAGSSPDEAYLVNIYVDGDNISYYKSTEEYVESDGSYEYVEMVTYSEDELKRELFESITGISLDYTQLELEVFDYTYLTASLDSAYDTSELTIQWSSSDETVATVSQWGCVDAYNVGETVITASYMGYSASCVVTVIGDGFSGACNTRISWAYDTAERVLTLSGSGAMPTYSYGSSVPWYSFRDQIKSIVIGSGITSVGKYAFYYCSAVENISIPNGVTLLDEYAFSWCSSLKSISIPSTVKTIDMYAFNYCSALESVTIPDGVDIIWNRAFFGCSSLKDINIPDSVVQIAQQAFSNCRSLESIKLPSKLSIISQEAFAYCSSLKKIAVPSSISFIFDDAFYGCDSLEEITVASDNTVYYSDRSGALFNYEKTKLMQYPAGNKSASYVIPSTVNTVNSYAFYNAVNLESVTIPDSVTTINTAAFKGCQALKSVKIPDSVTALGNYSFQNCIGLEEAELGSGLKAIGNYTFNNCKALKNVVIPSTVASVGSSAFSGCESLKSIALSESVTSIGSSAFSGCTALEQITIRGNITNLANGIFVGCSSLKSFTVPSSVITIGDSAFYNCTSLTDVKISSSIEAIAYSAFEGCSSLKSIVIPATVTTIGNYAFDGCKSLVHVGYECSEEAASNINMTENGNSELLEAPYIHYGFDAEADITLVSAKAPSCTENGNTQGEYCTECECVISGDIIPASGHSYTVSESYEGSCTEAPYNVYTCSACGDSYTVTESAFNGHRYEITVVSPTCTKYGYSIECCTVCGESSVTDFTSPSGHSLIVSKSDDFCSAHGTYEYICINCDYKECITADISELETETVITEASCTESGREKEICTLCGAVVSEKILRPTGHSFSEEWTVDKEATSAENGIKSRHCAFCDERKDITEFEYEGCVHSKTIIKNIKAATCTETGYTGDTACDSCGEILEYGSETAKTGHKYKEAVTAPTCTENGYTVYTCSVCSDSYRDNETEKTGHKYEEAVTAPTCTENGYTVYTCSVCFNSYRGNETAAQGHDMTDFVVVEAPSCTKKGTQMAECTRCDYVESEKIEETGHSFENGECIICGTTSCTHMCHKTGFMGFIWKIVRFFWKMFNMNPICECGVNHY